MIFHLLSAAAVQARALLNQSSTMLANFFMNCHLRFQDFVRHAVRLGYSSQGFKMLLTSADTRLTRVMAVLTTAALALMFLSIYMFGTVAAARKTRVGVRSVHRPTEVAHVESKSRMLTSTNQLDRPAGKIQDEAERERTAAPINRPDDSSDRPLVAIVNDDQSGTNKSAKGTSDRMRPVVESTSFVPRNQLATTAIAPPSGARPMPSGRDSGLPVSTAAFESPGQFDHSSAVKQLGTMVLPPLPLAENPVMKVTSVEPVAEKNADDERTRKRAAPATETATTANEAKGSGEAETIGVPPPREQPQFLRNDSVLMTPGDYQWEVGFSYARNLNQTPIGQIIGDSSFVGNLRRVNRVLQMPLELRIGLTEDLQGSVSLPIGWANQEISVAAAGLTDESFGIGDLTLGLTRLIRRGDLSEPNILGFFSLSIPTGQSSLATSLDDPSIALGRGFYSMTTGLTVTKTIDPLVFFFGGGYQHNLEASFSSVGRLNPGNGAFYRLGVGYAVNSSVSLSTAFTGAFLDNAELNDIRLEGTSREPLSLRIAATIVNKKKSVRKPRTVEPFVNLGLNEDATDTVVGVTWTY